MTTWYFLNNLKLKNKSENYLLIEKYKNVYDPFTAVDT